MSNISFIKNAFIYLHFVAWYLENYLRGIRLIVQFRISYRKILNLMCEMCISHVTVFFNRQG
jgi:hypothetical protein